MKSPAWKEGRVARTSGSRRELSLPARHGVSKAPRLSVVVTSSGDRVALAAALDSILPQCRRLGAELVVVSTQWRGQLEALRHSFFGARFVAAPTESGAAQQRALGLAECDGDIVVFTTDGAPVDEHWLASALPKGALERARLGAPWTDRVEHWRAYLSQRALSGMPVLRPYAPRDAAVGSD